MHFSIIYLALGLASIAYAAPISSEPADLVSVTLSTPNTCDKDGLSHAAQAPYVYVPFTFTNMDRKDRIEPEADEAAKQLVAGLFRTGATYGLYRYCHTVIGAGAFNKFTDSMDVVVTKGISFSVEAKHLLHRNGPFIGHVKAEFSKQKGKWVLQENTIVGYLEAHDGEKVLWVEAGNQVKVSLPIWIWSALQGRDQN
ncbi:hypothetical protein GG344DRAFT_70017 [Lentinula edodes]|nr:hypothetical protein GG344DRAFT_70017 [Lentinula edodes]